MPSARVGALLLRWCMRCTAALVLSSVAAPTALPAQDAAAVVRDPAGWTRSEVGDGAVLRQRWFAELFGSPQSLTVLEVQPAAARFDVVAPDRRRRTSEMAVAGGALAAINGGYFDIARTGRPTGLLRLDGALVVPADAGQGSLGITRTGEVRLAARPAGDWPEVFEALGAGPMLLGGGEVVPQIAAMAERRREARHPRSAIGLTASGTVVLLAVDGRTKKAAGMTFAETAQVLAALGCVDALNLDGGGSTTLWVAGRGVCNFPCDNQRYDHAGERAVATAVLVHAPAVVVVDDSEAELRGTGWQRRAGDAAHGGGFAFAASTDARAVFRAALPFGGRWRVCLWQGARGSSDAAVKVHVYGADSAVSGAAERVGTAPGGWVVVTEFLHPAGLPAIVTLAGDQAPVIADAVRFVQVAAAANPK
jgi:hypothetical protein